MFFQGKRSLTGSRGESHSGTAAFSGGYSCNSHINTPESRYLASVIMGNTDPARAEFLSSVSLRHRIYLESQCVTDASDWYVSPGRPRTKVQNVLPFCGPS